LEENGFETGRDQTRGIEQVDIKTDKRGKKEKKGGKRRGNRKSQKERGGKRISKGRGRTQDVSSARERG